MKLSIVSFSPIERDARVLRQAQYLSEQFEVTVIGYGHLGSLADLPIQMASISPPTGAGPLRKIRTLSLLPLGRVFPEWAYERWYWSRRDYQDALATLVQCSPNIIHANDWTALPVAARAAEQTGARILLDLHEYSPLQYENRWYWRAFRHPVVNYFLRRYIPATCIQTTVGELIADRYDEQFGFRPSVIMNAPRIDDSVAFRPVDPSNIRLVHHGAAVRDRRLELMIEVLARTDGRFTLHFMLINTDPDYTEELRRQASRQVPERVFFHEPVEPWAIARYISQFDMGIFFLPFTSFSYEAALPNKFFDFVNAGLAVCIGPSPEMALLTERYGFGIVAPSFDSGEVAAALNRLSASDINVLKKKAMIARSSLNADLEMDKLAKLHHDLATRLSREA